MPQWPLRLFQCPVPGPISRIKMQHYIRNQLKRQEVTREPLFLLLFCFIYASCDCELKQRLRSFAPTPIIHLNVDGLSLSFYSYLFLDFCPSTKLQTVLVTSAEGGNVFTYVGCWLVCEKDQAYTTSCRPIDRFHA